MVLTGVIQNLLHHIRMIQLFQDGNLLIDPLQGAFGLRGALRDCALCCFNHLARLTWETCLPHQPLLGQHLHLCVVILVVSQLDNTIGALVRE
uniref:Uncharacterized protein n=1 Tax=Cyclopterus lumpus TaxID=8103 RepID=A0A8C3AJ73_CYCLU